MKKIIWAAKESCRELSLFIWMILFLKSAGTLMCIEYFYYQNQLPDLKDYRFR